ncbi:hypothetical protein NLJ89_g8191 [Agrocybe chaxingu]|uniref:U4/U6.U5 small nuclear ribonucleoprotein 27kDa protein domain-containing protein n=1 Tax=Agrocybe chaxingu TaxID=84603 RepID=A0A9W8JVP4_9AGAR|nr:hypothetical protein NLJ89_g8191 [Agrocybe chaxingu]
MSSLVAEEEEEEGKGDRIATKAEDGPVVHGVRAETGIATAAEVQIAETGTTGATGKTSDPVDVIEIDAKTTEDGTAVTIDGPFQGEMTGMHRLATTGTLKIEKVSLETVLRPGLREGRPPTQGKHVEGNQEGAANVKKQRTWRQYMNRRGGFNRPLDKIK